MADSFPTGRRKFLRTVGATKPASETERPKNRRVEVIFVPEGGAAPQD